MALCSDWRGEKLYDKCWGWKSTFELTWKRTYLTMNTGLGDKVISFWCIICLKTVVYSFQVCLLIKFFVTQELLSLLNALKLPVLKISQQQTVLALRNGKLQNNFLPPSTVYSNANTKNQCQGQKRSNYNKPICG